MTSVRKSHGLILMTGLLLLVWACGGGGGSPTAPGAFEDNGTFEGQAAQCGSPPCGGGGGKNKGEDIAWKLSSSGPLGDAEEAYSLPSSESMDFDGFPLDMDVLASSSVENAAICFSNTSESYNGSVLEIERDNKNPDQLLIRYQFTGFRLEPNGQGGREMAYDIVFTDVVAVSSYGPPSWPPQVGTVTLTSRAYEVSAVAQRNNTCNGTGQLPSDFVLTLCGGGAC